MHLIAREGPLRGLILNFEEGDEWIIGRDPDQADLLLPDKTVSRKHAHCYKSEDRIFIKNLSITNPVEINGHPAIEEEALQENDIVKIGQTTFIYSLSGLPEEFNIEAQEGAAAGEESSAFETLYSPQEEPEEELPPEEEIPEEEPVLEEPAEGKSPYETIFETGGEDASLNLLGEPFLILKAISGPNNGAEFSLEKDKTYLLGKARSCDIVFNDLSVSKKHAELTIAEDGLVFLEDLGSKNKTLVNHAQLTDRRPISPGDLISIGTTTLVIIDPKAEAETIYAAVEEPQPEKATAEQVAAIAAEAEEKEEDKIPAWKKQIIPIRHLIFGGAALLFLFFLVVSLFSLLKTEEVKTPKINYAKEIKTVLEKYPGTEFTYNPGSSSLFLVGHVLTSLNQEELLYDLGQLTFLSSIDNKVVIDEYVWKNMNAVLSENLAWRNVGVYAAAPGKFVLSGYVTTTKDAEELINYVNLHFPYLNILENNLMVDEIINTQIANILVSDGFANLLFENLGGELLLSGRYDKKQQSAFDKLQKNLKAVKGIRAVKNLAIPTAASDAIVDLSNNFTVAGSAGQNGRNISVLINGRIISAGDVFENMMVKEIAPNTILLEKDGLKYKINYK